MERPHQECGDIAPLKEDRQDLDVTLLLGDLELALHPLRSHGAQSQDDGKIIDGIDGFTNLVQQRFAYSDLSLVYPSVSTGPPEIGR